MKKGKLIVIDGKYAHTTGAEGGTWSRINFLQKIFLDPGSLSFSAEKHSSAFQVHPQSQAVGFA